MSHHQSIASGAWGKMSTAAQLGNIGSELSRARHWLGRGDREKSAKSIERCLELLDALIASGGGYSRRKELALLRELVADWRFGGTVYGIPPQQLVDYCMPFALLARRRTKGVRE